MSSSLTSPDSLQFSMTLQTEAKFSLPLASKSKLLQIEKDNKSINLLYQFLRLARTMSSADPLSPIVSPW